MSKKIERRDFLKAAAAGAGGALLASCQPAATPTPETITVIETVEVIKDDNSKIRTFFDADGARVKIVTVYTIDYPIDNGLEKQVEYYSFDKKIKEERINIINAGHTASDNVGFNLLLDKVERKQKLSVIEVSGFRRFKRK